MITSSDVKLFVHVPNVSPGASRLYEAAAYKSEIKAIKISN